jgi:hypothetical protein
VVRGELSIELGDKTEMAKARSAVFIISQRSLVAGGASAGIGAP